MSLQARCEASETEVQRLQQRLHAASSDRNAELDHVLQLNRSLKAEIAALQNRLSGFADADGGSSRQLESFGSCMLPDHTSSIAQSLSQLHGGHEMPYLVAHRLAPIPEGDGSQSAQTSMQDEESLHGGGLHLVPELQSQVRALAASLHDKTQEADALHLAVERFRNEVRSQSPLQSYHTFHAVYSADTVIQHPVPVVASKFAAAFEWVDHDWPCLQHGSGSVAQTACS